MTIYYRFISSVILVISFLFSGGCTMDEQEAVKPNIVFILADDLGYGDVGAYNANSKIPTPHLDRLTEQGMRFTDAHAPASVCVPSRYGLLTGRNPHRINTNKWRKQPLIEPDQSTLATLLKNRGYTTYMVGKWHLGFKGGDTYDCSKPLRGGPTDRGFDHFFGIPASLDQPPYFYIRDGRCVHAPTDTTRGSMSEAEYWTDIQGPFWRAGDKAPGFHHEKVLQRFTEETQSYLTNYKERQAESPFFMYTALAAPHTPWLPADSLRGSSGAGMYGDFVIQVDHAVGRILNTLDRLGLKENTLVIFASDNGPVWYRKDVRRFGHRSTYIYRGMKSDAWEGGHRVPFIVRWPGHVPPASTSDQLLTFTDMMATIADISGEPLTPDSSDGYNLFPVFTGERDSIHRKGAIFQAIHYLAVRDGPWKLIPGLGSGGFISKPGTRKPDPGEPQGQLYHLGRDPGEQNNLYDERPGVVKRLREKLKRYRRQKPE